MYFTVLVHKDISSKERMQACVSSRVHVLKSCPELVQVQTRYCLFPLYFVSLINVLIHIVTENCISPLLFCQTIPWLVPCAHESGIFQVKPWWFFGSKREDEVVQSHLRSK